MTATATNDPFESALAEAMGTARCDRCGATRVPVTPKWMLRWHESPTTGEICRGGRRAATFDNKLRNAGLMTHPAKNSQGQRCRYRTDSELAALKSK